MIILFSLLYSGKQNLNTIQATKFLLYLLKGSRANNRQLLFIILVLRSALGPEGCHSAVEGAVSESWSPEIWSVSNTTHKEYPEPHVPRYHGNPCIPPLAKGPRLEV